MSAQPLRQAAGRNPRTIEEAREFVKYVESLFMPWNIDALVEGFTDDCIVRFGTVPEFKGRAGAQYVLQGAQRQAEALSPEEAISHSYERHNDERMERRMGGRRQQRPHAGSWRRGLGDARRQDRDLGSGLQMSGLLTSPTALLIFFGNISRMGP